MDYEKKYKDLYSRLKKVFNTTKSQEVVDMLYDNFREELYESEDERIRRAIVLGVRRCADAGSIFGTIISNEGVNYSEVLAWLERQKDLFRGSTEMVEQESMDGKALLYTADKSYEIGYRDGKMDAQKEMEIDVKDYRLRDTWAYIDEFIKKFGRVPKDIDELSACVDYVIKHKFIDLLYASHKSYSIGYRDGKKEAEQKHVECIKFDNEFENQVSYLLASILNGEHEYSNGFIKYAAQSLLGQAKNELNLTKWNDVTINGEPISTENQSVDIPLANWSEEDKKALDMCYELLLKAEYTLIDKGYFGSVQFIKDWLKSLPERFVLQSKHEWSEEDEKIMQTMIKEGDLKPSEIAWLKSLRPQPHTVSIKNATKFGNLEYERGVKDGIQSEKSRCWKPSEEQIEAFKKYIEEFQARAEAAVGGWNNFDVMVRLYEQLKKLM